MPCAVSLQVMRKNPAHTFIDLFAGAGGFSLGFNRAGFTCVGVVENDLRASETYKLNFPQHDSLPLSRLGPENGDILALTRQEIEGAGLPEIDVLLAAPPCQGFSKVGRGKLDHLADQEGAFKSDPRNNLYLKFLEVMEWIQPRTFLFENVPGILHFGGTNVAEAICDRCKAAGYKVLCTVLNSAWYGVPQIRERVFIFGIRSDLAIVPSFPRPIHSARLTKGHITALKLSSDLFTDAAFFKRTENPRNGPPAVSVLQALGDLPPFLDHLTDPRYRPIREEIEPCSYRAGRPSLYSSLMRRWNRQLVSTRVLDHFCRLTKRDFETFGLMKPGDMYPRAVEIAEKRYRNAKDRYLKGLLERCPQRKNYVPPYDKESFEEKWWKLIPSEPSRTITAHLARDCYSHIHYDTQKRAITVREAARLQSFPDAFEFCGNMGNCYRQIGNAVPPLLAFSLAKHIKRLLVRTDDSGVKHRKEKSRITDHA